MPVYYIAGISGSGKSTALEELRKRGYEAYDVDVAGPVTAKWHNEQTGYVHPKSSVKAADRTPEFLAIHTWKVPLNEFVSLAEAAGPKPVFVAGALANELDLFGVCETVFALTITDKILRERLAKRANNDWGKTKHELALSLAENQRLQARYAAHPYVCIDGSQPTAAVVSEILHYVEQRS